MFCGILAFVWSVLFIANVAINLYYGEAPYGGWIFSCIVLVVLSSFGSVGKTKRIAVTGFLAVAAFVLLSIYVSFDYAGVADRRALEPTEQFALATGIDFPIDDGVVIASRVSSVIPIRTTCVFFGYTTSRITVGQIVTLQEGSRFLSLEELDAALVARIPDAVLNATWSASFFLFVNLGDGDINVVPPEDGMWPCLLVEWNPNDVNLIYYSFVVF
jgi:hypothetical protein